MIRSVTLADAAAIADIYRYYVLHTTVSFELEPPSAERMAERVADFSSRYPFLVYEDTDGEILGYCYAHPWKGYPAYSQTFETTVYLRHGLSGQGIGRQLMQRLIEECRSLGAHVLIACITAENEGSIRFHQSLGFDRASLFSQVGHKFGRYLDVVDLQLIL